MTDVSAILAQLGLRPREFVTGWMEGRFRYQCAHDKCVISGSVLAPGSLGYAASQAAVAFHQALGDGRR